MWRLTPVSECGQPSQELAEIAGNVCQMDNGIPNFIRLLARSRASLIAYTRAEEALANGVLTSGQREKIALAVAEINGSDYCLAAHETRGKEAGLTEEEIRSARKATADDRKTIVMLHFTQALVLQRGEMSDSDFSTMRIAGFSEAEIIEVLANVVLNIFTNYFNILARTDLDHSTLRATEELQPAGGK